MENHRLVKLEYRKWRNGDGTIHGELVHAHMDHHLIPLLGLLVLQAPEGPEPWIRHSILIHKVLAEHGLDGGPVFTRESREEFYFEIAAERPKKRIK